MARQTIIVLQDDLTGKDIPDGEGYTIRFGLDGQDYEIDLNGANAAGMQKTLARYVDAGRKVKLNGHQPTRRRRRTSSPNGTSHGELTADATTIRNAMAAQQTFPTPAPAARFSSASTAHLKPGTYDPKSVRSWAERQGIDVPARGRVPESVVLKFREWEAEH